MKFTILQEDLNKALSTVSRSVSGKITLPILSNILLETEKGRLKLSATNLETGVNLWLGAKIDEEGSITVPAKILNELVASLPATKIDLETKESSLYINYNNNKMNVSGLDSSEFPKVPLFPEEVSAVFDKDDLIKSLAQVVISVAQDEGRPVLTGVLFNFKNDGLMLAATDGYRLSCKQLKTKELKSDKVSQLIIPGKTLSEVVRIAQETANEEGSVRMGLTKEKSQTVFSFPNVDFSSRLIEGEFPDYQKIIPKEATTKARFDKEELLRAVKIASIFAREQANIVKLKINPTENPDKVAIMAETTQVGANESEIEAKIEGEKLEIAFNFRFLIDFLNVVDSSEIIFEASGPLSPGVFRILEDDTFLHIIMPVRIQS